MHCAHYAHYALAHYAHNAHLSEHFLLQTHSLCTMHTMSICLNISLWQNIHFALCKKKLCKGIHYAHYTQTTVYLHSRFYTSHFSNVQQCAMSEHDECETHEGNDNSVLRLRHEGQFQISSTARFISSGNTALWQMGWVKLLGSSSHLRLSAARIF